MYNHAIENYKKAADIVPDYTYPYFKIGITFRKQGKYTYAIEAFKKAIEIDPEYFHPKGYLIELYLVVESFENAFLMAHEVLKEKDISKACFIRT